MTDTDHVEVDQQGGVMVIWLNRPDRMNAVSWDMCDGLVAALGRARSDDAIRCVVLTGRGRGFCGGADLQQKAKDEVPRVERKSPTGAYSEVTRALVGVDKPIVAALSGPVVGAGLAYALATDRRFADPTVRLSAVWAARGMTPDCGASYFLARHLRLSEALRLVCTGDFVEAEEALRIGLVDELVRDRPVVDAALDYAQRLAKGASVAIDLARRGVYKAMHERLDAVLDFEAFESSANSRTNDRKEGVVAFLKRREPNFTGT